MLNSTKAILQVTLDDPGGAYQITVLNNEFRVVGSGTGNLTLELDPGIFNVEANVSSQKWTKLVLLHARQTERVSVPVLLIDSAMPLRQTSQHHEYHEEAAYNESRKVHASFGSGSAIFILARRYSNPGTEMLQPRVHPMRGLTLHDSVGTQLTALQAISSSNSSEGMDPWAACTIEVNPGLYHLRMEIPVGDQVDLPLYACLGWQLQLFALQTAFGPNQEDLRPNLVEASICYFPFNPSFPIDNLAFSPNNNELAESYRLTELARLGLLKRRNVLRNETRDLLWQKFSNPMLGIFGGYLLLQETTPDFGLLQEVVDNLRRLLGVHPDVEALALSLDEPDRKFQFTNLTMLRRSWNQVIKASLKRRDIVPIDSEASNLSNHLWGEGLWLFSTVKPPVVPASAAEVIHNLIKTQRKQIELTPFESVAVQGMRSVEKSAASLSLSASGGNLPNEPKPLDDATAEMMVETLGVPLGNVELFLQRATDKARLYESVRTEMKPGWARTAAMTKILSQIRDAVGDVKESETSAVAQLIKENSNGSRIVAVAMIQASPDPFYLPFICELIGHSRSAFEQYQALSAALRLLPGLNADQKGELKQAIEGQRGILPRQYIVPGSDRWVLSDIILRQL